MVRVLALLVLLPACYTYRPLATAEPVVGSRVSIELTRDGTGALAGQVGPDVVHLEGRLVRTDPAGYRLAVSQVESARGIASDWNGEEISLPRPWVAGVQERRLSLGGTGVVGGLVAVGLYGAYRLIGGPGLLEGGGRGGGVGGR
jgi:hypothetical protein